MASYYNILMNNEEKHTVYAEAEDLEKMYHSNIIKEYTCTLDNWSIDKTYRAYFCNELRTNVDTLLRNMEESKGISNINHTEEAMKQIDQKIMEIYYICEYQMIAEENEED